MNNEKRKITISSFLNYNCDERECVETEGMSDKSNWCAVIISKSRYSSFILIHNGTFHF